MCFYGYQKTNIYIYNNLICNNKQIKVNNLNKKYPWIKSHSFKIWSKSFSAVSEFISNIHHDRRFIYICIVKHLCLAWGSVVTSYLLILLVLGSIPCSAVAIFMDWVFLFEPFVLVLLYVAFGWDLCTRLTAGGGAPIMSMFLQSNFLHYRVLTSKPIVTVEVNPNRKK